LHWPQTVDPGLHDRVPCHCLPAIPAHNTRPGFTSLVIAQTISIIFVAMFSGPLPAILREMFPTNVRFTALSISYGFA
jgi:hypothetical protein